MRRMQQREGRYRGTLPVKEKQTGGRAEQDKASQVWGVIMHHGIGDYKKNTQHSVYDHPSIQQNKTQDVNKRQREAHQPGISHNMHKE